MKILDIEQYNKLINFDQISMFNLKRKNNCVNIEKIKIIVFLTTNDSNFLNNFFLLSKLIMQIFNQKVNIFKIKRELFKGKNVKNNSIFTLGITLKKNQKYKFLNYILNVVTLMSSKIDNNLTKKITNFGLIYSFSNINYLIGLDNDYLITQYYKSNFIFNVNLIFKKKKEIIYENFLF